MNFLLNIWLPELKKNVYTFVFVISIVCNKTPGIAVCAQCTIASTFPMLVIIRIK